LKKLDNNHKICFELLKAGLWEGQMPVQEFKSLKAQDPVEWEKVYQLAQEQSIQGLVLAGLENSDLKPPKVLLLQWIGEVQMIEQRNKDMNQFIADLISKMREVDIYTLLVKGQGIAQCYKRPLWRSCGDIDLFLSGNNYKKAVSLLSPLATFIEEEDEYSLHQAFTINQWIVELHGTLRNGLWKRLNRTIDDTQEEVFKSKYVRLWLNGDTQINIPRADEDVIFIFTHFLAHFFQEGIGLRQICDWCRLLWTYKETLNHQLLESRIKSMGVMAEWKAFAALAVDYLGMPIEAVPFYSDDKKWKRKAVRVMEFVLETGNFGHNRDYSYQKKYPYIIYKAISFWKHLKDGAFFFLIFPLDSIKVTWGRMAVGVSEVLQGKKHK